MLSDKFEICTKYDFVEIFLSEKLYKDMADRLVADGYKDVGYNYVNIDDCWMAKQRDADGKLVGDPERFPSGMKALADYVSTKYIKVASSSTVTESKTGKVLYVKSKLYSTVLQVVFLLTLKGLVVFGGTVKNTDTEGKLYVPRKKTFPNNVHVRVCTVRQLVL